MKTNRPARRAENVDASGVIAKNGEMITGEDPHARKSDASDRSGHALSSDAGSARASTTTAMKKNKTTIKALRGELHYWQMMVRLDVRSLKLTRGKVEEIATKMRRLQREAA